MLPMLAGLVCGGREGAGGGRANVRHRRRRERESAAQLQGPFRTQCGVAQALAQPLPGPIRQVLHRWERAQWLCPLLPAGKHGFLLDRGLPPG